MSDPFHRTNLNLHRSDYEFLLARYGFGWTTQVRDLIHQRVEELRSTPTNIEIINQAFANIGTIQPTIDLDKLIREQEQ